MTVAKIGGLPAALPTVARPSVGGFSVPASPAGSAAGEPARAAGTSQAARASGLEAMLALQEQDSAGETAAQVHDREARKRGQGLLAALAKLQQALLGAGDAEAALQELASLADGPPAATAPLQAVLQSLSLRAKVELARRGL